ncbi:MAG: LiaF transmembrane domain-containing protein [Ignavibacterium sp.]|uniref:LiaF transmembrane domain-containing protein n=1 Tax=Ignavibacterium sp. TaxID=2651167 RepID=UPI00404A6BDB
MKTSHYFWGMFFISLGGLVLIGNLTDISFQWSTAWKFWPSVLILIGLSIMIKNQIGKNFIAALAGIILALSIYSSVSATTNLITDSFEIDIDDDASVSYDTTKFSQDYNDSIKIAALHFNGGAGSFKLFSATDKLVDFQAEGLSDMYSLRRNDSGTYSEIFFDMKKKSIKIGKQNYKNSVEISLNPNPEWDLNFDVGASSLDLDLTQFKVRNTEINMGAAALRIKYGNLVTTSDLKISAGASDIDILVPKEIGCEIKTDAALSSKNFKGFDKIKSDLYRTKNFNTAEKKLYIKIDCGISSIDVDTY